MNAALVPVRSLAGAKRRLSVSLSESDRTDLALAMLQDMTASLTACGSLARVIVLSADPLLLEHASAGGAETMREGTPKGLNAAVTTAAAKLEAAGVTRLLTIPGDVPLIDPVEIDSLFAIDARRYPVILVPSASGAGTNGLLTSPPTVLAPKFEGASLEAHRAAAREARLGCTVVALPSFALDVDTPEDLEALAAGAGTARSAILAQRAENAA